MRGDRAGQRSTTRRHPAKGTSRFLAPRRGFQREVTRWNIQLENKKEYPGRWGGIALTKIADDKMKIMRNDVRGGEGGGVVYRVSKGRSGAGMDEGEDESE